MKEKMIHAIQKIQSVIKLGCKIFEITMAVCVFIGIAIVTWNTFVSDQLITQLALQQIEFAFYLETIFSIVIGIEFMEMLCRPESANVLEILIFLMARHMIVGTDTMLDDFLAVIAICILCVVRRFLRVNKEELKARGYDKDAL